MAVDDSYTVVLLHGDGEDESQTITDESGKSWTAGNNAKIDTAQSVFGGASLYFDGTNDYIYTADSADFAFGSGAFTIDMRIRLVALPAAGAYRQLINNYGGAGNLQGWFWSLNNTSGVYYLIFRNYLNNAVNISVVNAITISVDTWYHLAVVRNGNNFVQYKDGTALSAATEDADAITDAENDLVVGISSYDKLASDYYGWMDEIRVSKGIARWTTDFTPPAAAYAPSMKVPVFMRQYRQRWG